MLLAVLDIGLIKNILIMMTKNKPSHNSYGEWLHLSDSQVALLSVIILFGVSFLNYSVGNELISYLIFSVAIVYLLTVVIPNKRRR